MVPGNNGEPLWMQQTIAGKQRARKLQFRARTVGGEITGNHEMIHVVEQRLLDDLTCITDRAALLLGADVQV